MKTTQKFFFFFSFALVLYFFTTGSCKASSYTTINPNKKISTRLETANRNLNYSVTIDKTGEQFFDFKFYENINNSVGEGFSIEVFTEDRKLIHGAYGITENNYFGGYFFMKKGEQLFIEIRDKFEIVDPINGIDTEFTFHTASVPREKEFDDSFETASKLSNNKIFIGNIYAPNDEDFFVYQVPRSGETDISFSISSRTGFSTNVKSGWDMEIYDANKKLIERKPGIISYAYSNALKHKKGQKIYIKISAHIPEDSPYLVDYELKAKTNSKQYAESEKNNSFKKANKLTSKKIGSLETQSDVDYYVFKAKKSGDYILKIATGNLKKEKYKVDIYSKPKKKPEITRVISESLSLSVPLKKGKKIWIKVSGVDADSTPIKKEYTLTIKK